MANTSSAAAPWTNPESSTSGPHWLPRRAETPAAVISANSAAPRFLTISGASTAGMSQTAYRRSFAHGASAKTPSSGAQIVFQNQNTTPNATPMTAVTTMSRVRHASGAAAPYAGALPVLTIAPEPPTWAGTCDADRGTADGVESERPASFAGTNQIRFRGSVAIATLSALDGAPRRRIRLSGDGSTERRSDPWTAQKGRSAGDRRRAAH